jgi:hypothetical protein
MNRYRRLSALAAGVPMLRVLAAGPVRGGSETTPTDLMRRAEVIKPSAGELKWQRIPWLTDLTKGQIVARAERRPIFLWVTGDDPLERR